MNKYLHYLNKEYFKEIGYVKIESKVNNYAMDELDKKDWEIFRAGVENKISKEEVKMISKLHAKYFNHKYKVPCSCSPKLIQGWIEQLNDLYVKN
tara:strand:- start:1052 stop:1336 length:285 start_codon:yes stop_codon:yes gene_type:complete